MPKIDFYILEDANAQARQLFVCRLIEKAYKNRHRLYIHCEDETQTNALDELLWTYRDDSFLPHNIVGEGPDPAPPIQLGFGEIPEKQRDILINLQSQIPNAYERFSRVLEIVNLDPLVQANSREHFRFYKTAGHTINTHKLSTVE